MPEIMEDFMYGTLFSVVIIEQKKLLDHSNKVAIINTIKKRGSGKRVFALISFNASFPKAITNKEPKTTITTPKQ